MRFNVEISLIFYRILGPLVLDWAPNHFVLGAQLAPGEKMLVCIPEGVIELHASTDRSQTQHEHLKLLLIHLNVILQIRYLQEIIE